MSDDAPKKEGRVTRRLNRIRHARNRDVGPKKVLFAAGVSGAIAAVTIYLIFYMLGVTELDWTLSGIAFGVGFLFGAFIGVGSWRSGVGAGIIAGIWIFMEILTLTIALMAELIGAVIGAMLSGLSF